MKRLLISFALLLLVNVFMPSDQVYGHELEDQEVAKVELTEKQKKDIEKLYDKLFETHKKIIEKYKNYGVLTDEKANKILEVLEKRQKQLKENGYSPEWDHKKHHNEEE